MLLAIPSTPGGHQIPCCGPSKLGGPRSDYLPSHQPSKKSPFVCGVEDGFSNQTPLLPDRWALQHCYLWEGRTVFIASCGTWELWTADFSFFLPLVGKQQFHSVCKAAQLGGGGCCLEAICHRLALASSRQSSQSVSVALTKFPRACTIRSGWKAWQ